MYSILYIRAVNVSGPCGTESRLDQMSKGKWRLFFHTSAKTYCCGFATHIHDTPEVTQSQLNNSLLKSPLLWDQSEPDP